MSPVATFMNKAVHEHRSETLFSVDKPGMELNTTFHDRWLADHLVASTTLGADHWILFDSGASANCCPKDFGEEWPLLLNGEPPPSRSISGQPLHVFLIRWFLLQSYFCRDTRWTWTSLTLWEHLMGKKPGLLVMVHFCSYALNWNHSTNMTLHPCAMDFMLSSTLRLLLAWWQLLTQCAIDTLKKVTESKFLQKWTNFTEELLVSYSGCQIWDVTSCMQPKNFQKD